MTTESRFTRSRRIAWVLCTVACCLLGACAASPKIIGRIVTFPSLDEFPVLAKFQNAQVDKLTPDQVKQHVAEGLATGHPFVVMAAIARASEWVSYGPGGSENRAARSAVFMQFIEQCLRSPDAFNRMSGLLALSFLEDDKRLAAELERDSTCLLVRPEPADPNLFDAEPAMTQEATTAKVGAMTSLAGIVQTRHRLIDACGRLGIEAARKNLEAIAADSQGRLVEETAETAQKALDMLDRKKSRKGSYGMEFLTEEEGREFTLDDPEIELRGTTAQIRVENVRSLTLVGRELCQSLIEALNGNDAGGLVQLCESAIETQHPYMALRALEVAGIWGYGRPGAVRLEARLRVVMPLIERCLASKEPYLRMAGAVGLQQLRDFDRLRVELGRDSEFLLLKAEPTLTFNGVRKPEERIAVRENWERATDISCLRMHLVRTVGNLRVESARPILEAILLDPTIEFNVRPYVVRRAIAQIDGTQQVDPN